MKTIEDLLQIYHDNRRVQPNHLHLLHIGKVYNVFGNDAVTVCNILHKRCSQIAPFNSSHWSYALLAESDVDDNIEKIKELSKVNIIEVEL